MTPSNPGKVFHFTMQLINRENKSRKPRFVKPKTQAADQLLLLKSHSQKELRKIQERKDITKSSHQRKFQPLDIISIEEVEPAELTSQERKEQEKETLETSRTNSTQISTSKRERLQLMEPLTLNNKRSQNHKALLWMSTTKTRESISKILPQSKKNQLRKVKSMLNGLKKRS